ncbi:MAG: PaaI family thioesterase, partial [Alphaproteobacteria bacterium]
PLAVTTSLTINFLRKPLERDLLAHVQLLKLGRRLAVGDVRLYSEGSSDVVAQANGTYSLPPR